MVRAAALYSWGVGISSLVFVDADIQAAGTRVIIVVAFVPCAATPREWGEQRDSARQQSKLCAAWNSEKMMPEEEQSEPIFDPKSFLETLFKSREAEIQVIFHNSTHNDTDTDNQESDHDDFKPDLYFVIGAVSFVLFLVIFWATCKAIQMLKISLDDGIDDTVPVPDRRSPNENVQSVASGHFLAGKLFLKILHTF